MEIGERRNGKLFIVRLNDLHSSRTDLIRETASATHIHTNDGVYNNVVVV